MENPQLLNMKTNPSPQPRRCCHQNDNGTHCQAHPQRDSQYCFFHDPDPAAQQKTAEARRAGGVIRSRGIEAEAAPILPPNLPLLSLKTPAAVAGLYEETINQVRQGQIDLRAANTIGYLATMLLTALESTARTERQKEAERQKEEAEAKAAHPDQPRGSSGKKQPFSDIECHMTDLATGTVRITKGGVTTVIPPPQPRIPPDPPLPGDPYHHDEHASIESRAEASNARQRAVIDNWLAQERSRSNLNGTSGSKPLSPPGKPEPRPQSDASPPRLETTAIKTKPVEAPKAEPPKPTAASVSPTPAASPKPAVASVPPIPAASPDKQAKYQHKPEPPGCPTHWRYWNE